MNASKAEDSDATNTGPGHSGNGPDRSVILVASLEGPTGYLKEWIAHHVSVGVRCFLLLDRGTGEAPAPDFPPAGAAIEVRTVRGRERTALLREAVRQHDAPGAWMTVLSLNEFLVPKLGGSLPKFLTAFESHGAVIVKKVFFAPPSGAEGSLRSLAACRDSFISNESILIFQPCAVERIDGERSVTLKPDWGAVSEHFEGEATTMHIQVNHYLAAPGEKVMPGAPLPPEPAVQETAARRALCIDSDDSLERLSRPRHPPSGNDDAPLITGFIHVAAINDWKELLFRQIDKAARSGLLERTDRIWLGIVGSDGKAVEELGGLPGKISVAFCRPELQDYEFPTLELLQRHCRERGGLVWYTHLKGVANRFPWQAAWREKMEEFVLIHHEIPEDRLRRGYRVAGAFIRPDHVACPVPGNFWWARASHVAELPEVSSLDWRNRFEAETWIGRNGVTDFYWHDLGDTILPEATVISSTVAAGRLSTSGYHGWLRIPVRRHRDWPADGVLSAHAPSVVRILTHRPLWLFGFTCPSGKHGGWRVRFVVNGTPLAEVAGAGIRTPEVELPPGTHLLEAHLLSGKMWGAHTVWAWRGADSLEKGLSSPAPGSA